MRETEREDRKTRGAAFVVVVVTVPSQHVGEEADAVDEAEATLQANSLPIAAAAAAAAATAVPPPPSSSSSSPPPPRHPSRASVVALDTL